MLKLCYCMTLSCTTFNLFRDQCLIQALVINLCPEILGCETCSQDNLSLRPSAGIRMVTGPHQFELVVKYFNISNCRVQSLGVASSHVYSHVDQRG